MSDAPRSPTDSAAAAGSLTERVAREVALAVHSAERRASAVRPRGRRRASAAAARSPGGKVGLEEVALRAVFRRMGHAYRQYRRQTGEPVLPALRSAALAFRQEPSLLSLVPVAGFLDELELLTW